MPYKVRQATTGDVDALLEMLARMPAPEQRYLGLPRKSKLVRQMIRKGKHVTVAESPDGELVGFLRESGRPGNKAMVEELYVVPEARRRGAATALLDEVRPRFDGLEAKTFAENQGINRLLTSKGFQAESSPKGTILNWSEG